ncbi:glycosyl hydrolase family 43 [Paenibacillus albidus]|uniref:Glycosyl hydrolase family 43 n=1 Tax=Paenibacillus albidus TaxID=2041023 RepID=A0A917C9X9_9BACL|nr:glycoside hydrolase family 43 protein [Paenibacillus albidus]GGF79668.1 glycosyl hydrolase family 43 [Paenibacillus albidus]
MTTLSEINFRDPFILASAQTQLYYLFGTAGQTAWSGTPEGFDVYTSPDLVEWSGPFPAFRPEPGFWADHHFWAPEVHAYKDKYYMFASFKSEGIPRGTQILVADEPQGLYHPNSSGPVTPAGWECLDGTLYVDQEGQPWMVFCREWLEVTDGEMYAVRLNEELSAAAGEPVLLFRASEAPWSVGGTEGQYVTDGPFLHPGQGGELLMLWSSGGASGYAMGLARSASGSICGPWTQDAEPLYAKDGGHGMLFRDFAGRLLLTIHTPNRNPEERPVLLEVQESSRQLNIGEL